MRAHALQFLRPIRSGSPALQCVRIARPALTASVSSSTTTSSIPPAWRKKATTGMPVAKPKIHNTGYKPIPAEELASIDPQVAMPAAAVVTDVDTSLAGSIPTPTTTKPTTAKAAPAFTAAVTNGSNLSATPNGDGVGESAIDWSQSFHGLATAAFAPETAALLMAPLDPEDVEIKPDGIIYLPEIKYRRILNQAFGPGGWGLAPRGELTVGEKVVTREYALIVNGRFIAQARGECLYFSEETIPTAGEGSKSNALLRCCKDLGIASELWDPRFIRTFKKKYAHEVWVEHVVNKKKRQIWTLKGVEPGYPYAIAKK
ncbi:mitochondrial genome maintenance MGM101-domain-containing protein [Lasiosphaeria hispida]|uniref:Mitochondrial genome maintenance protein MGM101 n=1 Tax=Lasiosphaeria hispida TaxID=260671 RepID=A0AAJ0MBH2_9PEZI|nr:mitochondrial genome maintenance MGM101-domain-containing protein [Lasiosphaeria hispida]